MLISIVVANLVVSAVALSGAVLLLVYRRQTQALLPKLVGLAAGVLLTSSFLDILPEAIEETDSVESVLIATFSGILVFFTLERFLLWFHHHHEPHGAKPANLLILVGDGIHNTIDGIAIAAAFLANPLLGIQTTIAVIAHEAPHEFSDVALLVGNGMKAKKALWFNLLSGLTAVIGGVAGFFFLEISERLIPLLLGFTAGMFIYIAASDLIPEMHQEFARNRQWNQTVPFVLGIFIAIATRVLLE